MNAMVGLLLCVSVLVSAWLSCSFPKTPDPLIAVAVKSDGNPSPALYAGNPRAGQFRLPAGEYHRETFSPEGLVHGGWREAVEPAQGNSDSLPIRLQARGEGKP